MLLSSKLDIRIDLNILINYLRFLKYTQELPLNKSLKIMKFNLIKILNKLLNKFVINFN